MQTNIDLNTSHSKEEQSKKGVYKILNLINNKFYIGSVCTKKETTRITGFRRRWQKHMNDLLKNIHCNKHLQGSFNTYGREAFKFIILEVIEDNNIILEREQYWIDTSNCLDDNIGYNKYPLAQSINRDYVVSKETRQKIRESTKGKPRPMWMKLQYGKPIYQYSLDGEFIREWYSATEAERVTGIHRTGIKDALKGRATRKTAGGFIWKYK